MKERPQQFRTLTGLVDVPIEFQFQVQQVVRDIVRQVAILGMVPHMFHRIEVWGVRRQPLDPEAIHGRAEGVCLAAG